MKRKKWFTKIDRERGTTDFRCNIWLLYTVVFLKLLFWQYDYTMTVIYRPLTLHVCGRKKAAAKHPVCVFFLYDWDLIMRQFSQFVHTSGGNAVIEVANIINNISFHPRVTKGIQCFVVAIMTRGRHPMDILYCWRLFPVIPLIRHSTPGYW